MEGYLAPPVPPKSQEHGARRQLHVQISVTARPPPVRVTLQIDSVRTLTLQIDSVAGTLTLPGSCRRWLRQLAAGTLHRRYESPVLFARFNLNFACKTFN